MKSRFPSVFPLLSLSLALVSIAAAPRPADANGNFSHVWVATDALQYLEAGELRDLLTRDDLREILRNGAMYPDGGYAIGDGYGEISHWEPFHLTYLDWIRTNFASPWSDEAARHIAFLMGMATHGTSDQLYDAMYLTRHAHYDENGSEAYALGGVDGATDSCFAGTQGPMALPEPWVPAEVLAPLYAVRGHDVDAATIEAGHNLVRVAIMVANDAAVHPDILDDLLALYPWACGHQNDPGAPGSPPTHGPAVARYWGTLWDRLHGIEDFDQPLLGVFSTGMTLYDVPGDAGTPDSWVSFAMPHGLDPGTVNAATVSVTGGDGAAHPVALDVYYGFNSHLVNIKPQENWAPDSNYTVTISPPLASWEGTPLGAPLSFGFSTSAAPAVADVDTPDVTTEEIVEEIVEEVTGAEPAVENPDGRTEGTCTMSGRDAPVTVAPLALLLLLGIGLRIVGHRRGGTGTPLAAHSVTGHGRLPVLNERGIRR
ncbi:MAG: Ig-like domain-containing protein [Pseudomonadota bacterium]